MAVTVTFTDQEYETLMNVILDARIAYKDKAKQARDTIAYNTYTELIQKAKQIQYKLAYQPRDI